MWNHIQILTLQLFAHHWIVKAQTPYLLTVSTFLYLATTGIVDYSVGLFTDFRHLPLTETPALVLNQVDTLRAYLVVNTIYTAYRQPAEYSLLSDCVGPMGLFVVLNHLRENPLVNSLRPLFVGVLPTLMSGNFILWFRVAAPLYAMRFLIMDQAIWLTYIAWISYNIGVMLFMFLQKERIRIE